MCWCDTITRRMSSINFVVASFLFGFTKQRVRERVKLSTTLVACTNSCVRHEPVTLSGRNMSDDSDDDMPVLNTATAGVDPQEQAGKAESPSNVTDELLESWQHPASKAVLIPQKLFKVEQVHPAAIEPVIRDAKAASAKKEEGNKWFKQGQLRKAEECYTEALLLSPLSADHDYSRAVFHGNRAACYLKMTLYDKCIRDCTESIALSPKYVKVIMRRAKAYELKEDLEAALADVKAVLEIDPSYTLARKECIRLEKAVTEKQEKMKEEVMGKLKSLGNTILGKFGLSLDNFKMQPKEDGTYSMSFEQ